MEWSVQKGLCDDEQPEKHPGRQLMWVKGTLKSINANRTSNGAASPTAHAAREEFAPVVTGGRKTGEHRAVGCGSELP